MGEGDRVSSEWVFFSEGIWRLSGILNVILFILTRRGLLLFGNNAPVGHGEALGAAEPGGQDDMQMGRLPDVDDDAWLLRE